MISEAGRLKLSLIMRANNPMRRKEISEKVSKALKGKAPICASIKGETPWNKGKSYPQVTGEKHWNWQGGISVQNRSERANIMRTLDYKTWRQSVFLRDNFECVNGGKNHGKQIEAHHIKPFALFPEQRFLVENGVTLCKDCHKRITFPKNAN